MVSSVDYAAIGQFFKRLFIVSIRKSTSKNIFICMYSKQFFKQFSGFAIYHVFARQQVCRINRIDLFASFVYVMCGVAALYQYLSYAR